MLQISMSVQREVSLVIPMPTVLTLKAHTFVSVDLTSLAMDTHATVSNSVWTNCLQKYNFIGVWLEIFPCMFSLVMSTSLHGNRCG